MNDGWFFAARHIVCKRGVCYCHSFCLSVCHIRDHCQNGLTYHHFSHQMAPTFQCFHTECCGEILTRVTLNASVRYIYAVENRENAIWLLSQKRHEIYVHTCTVVQKRRSFITEITSSTVNKFSQFLAHMYITGNLHRGEL